jgi:hypothetical protein
MSGSNDNNVRPDLARHRSADIAAQFPEALNDSELEQVTRRIERLLGSIDELRRYPLTNADESASIFHPIGKEQP